MIRPGPTWDLSRWSLKFKALSEWSSGLVLTSSTRTTSQALGDYEVRVLKRGPGLTIRLLEAAMAAGRDRPFDLVVSYDALKTGLISLLAARALRTKMIVELSGDYANPANFVDEQSGRVRNVRWLSYRSIARFVARRADGTKTLYPEQLPNLGVKSNKPSANIFDFVDLRDFVPLSPQNLVLLVGFPYHVKGVDVMIEAFRKVAPRFPDWHLKIIGFYPDPTEILSKINGHPCMHLEAPMPRPKLAREMGASGIFVLPSRTEAMGRVLLEAAACGRPRIGTYAGGIPTVIQDGVDGLLVPPDDPSALAEKLDELMSSTSLREQLGAQALARAKREFTVEAYSASTQDFYRRVVGSEPVLDQRGI